MPRYVEQMTRVVEGRFTCRLWRKSSKHFPTMADPDRLGKALHVFRNQVAKKGLLEVCERMGKEDPHLNAIEILNEMGNGIVWYRSWP